MVSPQKPRPRGARRKSIAELQREKEAHEASEQSPVRHGYFKSFDGTRLFYSVEGKGKPLIFCYGLVCTSLHWTYQIDHFQKTHQAVWFDYRGHQNSDVPKDLGSLTLDNMARDLALLLDELGIQDAVLLGHSMGVNVVLEFYRQHPDRVAGMILANGTSKRPLETIFDTNATEAAFDLLLKAYDASPRMVEGLWKMAKGNPLAHLLVGLGGFNPHLTPQADIAYYVDQVADMDPAVFINLIRNYGNCDSTAWLHTVKAPTLIIAGENDKVIPPEQQELLNQLIPNSQIEVIRHGSHCPQMDLPELVNMKIEAFLNSINYGASGSNPTKGSASRSTAKDPAPGPTAVS